MTLHAEPDIGERVVEGASPQGSPTSSRFRGLLHDPAFLLSSGFILAVVLVAVLADVLAPADPLEQDLGNVLLGPSTDHWLGTDELGRDVLSRMMFAARVSLKASLLAVGIALIIGFPLGLFVGYRGGRWETVTMRFSDGLMALPGLLIVIAVIGVMGNSLLPAMVALGVVLAPSLLRLTRGVALGIRNEPYIDAAKALGLRNGRIIGRHVLPHVVPALVVQTSLLLGAALLIEAGLSFIGLGIQPPDAGWGSMLSKAAGLFREQPFVLLPPGVMITLTVLAFNVLGDTVRDVFMWSGTTDRTFAPSRPVTELSDPDRQREEAAAERVAAPSDAVLRIRDLTVAFGSGEQALEAVTGVDVDVGAGRAVGVVGESGCGKTITALASMMLLPGGAHITSGSVRVLGRELVGLSDAELCRIRGNDMAIVLQDPTSSLDPAHTVGDQIGESLRVHRGLSRRAARARAAALLDQVGIADSARRVRCYPHEFSGGMLQRVAIAAALACDPALLIADEPTSALDVTVQAEILLLLREQQQARGMALLLVTHDLGVIARICDEVVVMYAGQVVEHAPVATLFSAPAHPYTRALLEAMPRPEHRGADLPTIPGTVPALHAFPRGCRFAGRCGFVRPECGENDIPLRSIDRSQSARCILAGGGRGL